MTGKYDVIIVGGGPAGISAAYELIKLDPNLKILLTEKGPIRTIDDKKNTLFGFGGAGAFSDGKLTLSSEVGGQLNKLFSPEELKELMDYVVNLYEKFGGEQETKIGKKDRVLELTKKAKAVGLELIPYPVKHWGREGAYLLIENIRKYLESRIEILCEHEVVSIKRIDKKFGIILDSEESYCANSLMLAPGRAGANWLANQMEKLRIKMENNPVDLGIRVEAERLLLDELTENLYDFKLRYLTRERRDLVRTFCVCPGGKVVIEEHLEEDPYYAIVNGKTDKTLQTKNTNFAILVTMPFTEPFKDANAYGKHVARLATLLANGSVLVQTLADFQNKRRSKLSSLQGFPVRPTLSEAAPGDLRLVLPERFSADISETLEVLDKFIPGINNGNNILLYGVEVKFYSRRVTVQKNCQTSIPGLYVIGDGSGWTRGLLWSSAMAVIAARDIVDKKKN